MRSFSTKRRGASRVFAEGKKTALHPFVSAGDVFRVEGKCARAAKKGSPSLAVHVTIRANSNGRRCRSTRASRRNVEGGGMQNLIKRTGADGSVGGSLKRRGKNKLHYREHLPSRRRPQKERGEERKSGPKCRYGKTVYLSPRPSELKGKAVRKKGQHLLHLVLIP